MENKGKYFRPKIREVIIVEGRDDTMALNRAVDCITIETHGWGISRKTWERIDNAYKRQGIIVFTDPDHAGGKIRRTVTNKFPMAKQAYISRTDATKKGNIGVENADPESIRLALSKAKSPIPQDIIENKKGSALNKSDNVEKSGDGNKATSVAQEISSDDLQRLGLIGNSQSSKLRERVGDSLGIGYSNGKTFLKRIKGYGISLEELEKEVRKYR